jgi:hypothetical protein
MKYQEETKNGMKQGSFFCSLRKMLLRTSVLALIIMILVPLSGYSAKAESSDFLIYHKKLVSHFVSFKKSYYNRTIGMDATLRCAEDRDLYYKLEEVGKFLHLPVPLYYYRINNENSVSIGSEAKDTWGYYYSVCAELNAICRRMGGDLYRKNRDSYRKYMRKILRAYYGMPLFRRSAFLKYSFYYLKAYHFSPRAMSHLYKITKGR